MSKITLALASVSILLNIVTWLIKSAKIESALHSINFGNRAVFDMSEATIAPKISVTKKSDGRYEVSINGAVDPDFSVTEYDVLYDFGDGKNSGVTWDTLQDELVEKYGGYLIVRHSNGTRYLDYLDQITEKNPQPIAFGTNLLDLTSYVKAEDIVTRVVAVGKQTSGWFIWETTKTITATANDLTAQKLFGIITRVIVVDGTASTLQSLQDAADEELANNLRYLDGITVKAVDLKDADIDIGRIGFGKMTHIYSGLHGVDTAMADAVAAHNTACGVGSMRWRIEDAFDAALCFCKCCRNLIAFFIRKILFYRLFL